MPDTDTRLVKLEQRFIRLALSSTTPGTALCREAAPPNYAKSLGLSGTLLWALSLGGLAGARTTFRGHTIEDCLQKAEAFVEQRERSEIRTKPKRMRT